MRVKSISVKGLFGVFDHEIPLQSMERVTVVHGPNGLGKTVMLRMIAAVAAGTSSIFEHTPFTEFCLTLEDGTARIIRRTKEKAKKGKYRVRLELLMRDAAGKIETLSQSLHASDVPQSVLEEVDHQVPGPFQLSGSGWVDDVGRRYSLADIIQRFPKVTLVLPSKYRPTPMIEDLHIFFIDTNRLGGIETSRSGGELSPEYVSVDPRYRMLLEAPRNRPIAPRVRQNSEDILRRIQSALAAYAKHSQESDRTFPERLVRFVREKHSEVPEGEILAKMAELEKKRQRLISLGVLDKESGLSDLSEQDVLKAPEALTIYVEDVQEKLKVFDDLANRIGSLMDIVNDRFKYKSLRVDREKGFRVLSDLDQTIDLEDLSSGEQHELVVLYELLFRAPKNGLVLIDEPEISLHVAWQSRFLSDLIGVLAVTDAYAIVATHSPVIIGNRTDLAVELKGPAVPQ